MQMRIILLCFKQLVRTEIQSNVGTPHWFDRFARPTYRFSNAVCSSLGALLQPVHASYLVRDDQSSVPGHDLLWSRSLGGLPHTADRDGVTNSQTGHIVPAEDLIIAIHAQKMSLGCLEFCLLLHVQFLVDCLLLSASVVSLNITVFVTFWLGCQVQFYTSLDQLHTSILLQMCHGISLSVFAMAVV